MLNGKVNAERQQLKPNLANFQKNTSTNHIESYSNTNNVKKKCYSNKASNSKSNRISELLKIIVCRKAKIEKLQGDLEYTQRKNSFRISFRLKAYFGVTRDLVATIQELIQ